MIAIWIANSSHMKKVRYPTSLLLLPNDLSFTLGNKRVFPRGPVSWLSMYGPSREQSDFLIFLTRTILQKTIALE
jgi:hypothetical protein